MSETHCKRVCRAFLCGALHPSADERVTYDDFVMTLSIRARQWRPFKFLGEHATEVEMLILCASPEIDGLHRVRPRSALNAVRGCIAPLATNLRTSRHIGAMAD